MQSFSSLSDNQLHDRLSVKVQVERNITLEILHLLRETERRRKYRGYSSLFEYCVRELKYSESSAQRRISAMRLLKEIPETESALRNGSLNLSSVAAAQSFFRQEYKDTKKIFSKTEKQAVLKKLEYKSFRDSQRMLVDMASSPRTSQEHERALSSNETELTVVVDQETMNLLREVKALRSHKSPKTADCLKEGLKLILARETKRRAPKKIKEQSLAAPIAEKVKEQQNAGQTSFATKDDSESSLPAPVKRRFTRFIPSAVFREVYQRDNGRCTFMDKTTNRRCGSTWYVQLDHIKPLALGGETVLENLRLLCRNHNLAEAHEKLGAKFMESRIQKGKI